MIWGFFCRPPGSGRDWARPGPDPQPSLSRRSSPYRGGGYRWENHGKTMGRPWENGDFAKDPPF